MALLPDRLAAAIVVAVGLLALSFAFVAPPAPPPAVQAAVEARVLLAEAFVSEALLPGADEAAETAGPPLDPEMERSLRAGRRELKGRALAILDRLPAEARERGWIATVTAVIDGDPAALPAPLPADLPEWLAARAEAVRDGAEGEAAAASRLPARKRLARWSALGFLALFTVALGLLALILSPRIFDRDEMEGRALPGIRPVDAGALVGLWAIFMIVWDGLVAPLADGAAAMLTLHYVPVAGVGVALMAWAMRRVGATPEAVGVVPPEGPREAARWATLGYLGLALVVPGAFIAAWLTSQVIPASPDRVEPLLPLVIEALERGHGPILFAVVVVLAPIFEELLFRGFLQGALRPHMSATRAILLQAAAFALLHFSASKILILFALGVVLGLLRERWGVIGPCVAMHALWNGATLLAFTFLLGG